MPCFQCQHTSVDLRAQVFTFDEHGASWHANHRSVHRAVRLVQADAAEAGGRGGEECSESGSSIAAVFYYLQSVPLWRKYLGALDVLFLPRFERESSASATALPRVLVFAQRSASLPWAAMQQHASQFVWYRRAAVWMSCYSYINVMRAEDE